MSRSALGILIERDVPPELLRHRVQLVEDAGIEEVWFPEDLTFSGGIATVATALANSTRLKVGLGILPAVARNPVFAAMEVSALSRLYPGRILCGFGHGMQDWMATAGALPESPLTALDETLTCVGGLLHGRSINFQGQYVRLKDVQLEFPPLEVPPILAGVRGPRSIRLAGAVCDGIILAEPLSAAYIRWARELVEDAALRAGRGRPTVVAYTWLSIAEDSQVAYERVRPQLASIPGGLSEPSVRRSLETLDFGTELSSLIDQAQSQHELAAALRPEWVDQLSVAGTPEQCASAIRRLVSAGADRVVLIPMPDDVDDQVALLARDVLPRLDP